MGAAGQQAIWTVAPVTRAEQPLTGQRQVLVPVWGVVRVGLHNLLIQLPSKHTQTETITKADVTKNNINKATEYSIFALCCTLICPIIIYDSIAACLLRSDSQCKTAQRGELSPLPASLLPGQTERKPSSS